MPGYAFGSGPAYLSGQILWYAGAPGQVAVAVVDPTYAGPVLVRVQRVDGSGRVTLANLDLPSASRLPVMLGSGTNASGGVEVQAPPPSPPHLWREWDGRLTADQPGCYALQIDGTSFCNVVVSW